MAPSSSSDDARREVSARGPQPASTDLGQRHPNEPGTNDKTPLDDRSEHNAHGGADDGSGTPTESGNTFTTITGEFQLKDAIDPASEHPHAEAWYADLQRYLCAVARNIGVPQSLREESAENAISKALLSYPDRELNEGTWKATCATILCRTEFDRRNERKHATLDQHGASLPSADGIFAPVPTRAQIRESEIELLSGRLARLDKDVRLGIQFRLQNTAKDNRDAARKVYLSLYSRAATPDEERRLAQKIGYRINADPLLKDVL